MYGIGFFDVSAFRYRRYENCRIVILLTLNVLSSSRKEFNQKVLEWPFRKLPWKVQSVVSVVLAFEL